MRAIRKLREMTQRELAEETGVKKSNIAAMESGARTMSMKMAGRLAEILDVEPVEIYVENHVSAIRRAMVEGDVERVHKSARAIFEVSDPHEMTPEGAAVLDRLYEGLLDYARRMGGAVPGAAVSAKNLLDEDIYDEDYD